MSVEGLVLVGIGGICWTIVYNELIRNGVKDKTCGNVCNVFNCIV